MDSAISNAEHDIIFGASEANAVREKGELTSLSGFNDEHDSQVTKYH